MDKDTLIEQLIKEKGGTREQYLSLLNQIAYHESAHTMDPTIKQRGGGPGRGVYQFEEGKDAGGITAARRTERYLKSKGSKVPDWLTNATKGDSLDATKLSKNQQDVLFLGNMRMHPKADFSNYVSGKESTEDFWANYHWAGKAVDRDDRLAAFDTSRQDYKKKYNRELTSVEPKRVQPVIQQPQQEQYQAVADNIQQPQQQQVAPQMEQYPLHEQRAVDLYSYMKSGYQDEKFNEFNGGGTHEQNPKGGIPQGIGANGKQNTVEEGETSYDFKKDGKYVFSDRIDLFSYVNSSKSKKQDNKFATGGKLDGVVDPTKPTTVKHGTKAYAKAYNDGTFADIPNQLDEVLITADGKTGKNILKEYPHYNDLSAQDKEYWNDPSPIGRGVRRKARTKKGLAGDAANMGAQLGQGALSAIQMPQSAMVEGVEGLRGKSSNMSNALPGGKQRFPSNAWGYKNPEGFLQNAANFGMDVVADPTNLVGAGIGAKLMGRGVAKAVAKKTVGSVKGGLKVGSNFTRNIPKQVENITSGVPTFNPTPHIPSTPVLQVKTIMEGSPLLKQANKQGEISVDLVRNFLNKNGTPAADKEIISKVLDKEFASQSKVSIEGLKKAVNKELIPLKRSYTDQYASYGTNRINFENAGVDQIAADFERYNAIARKHTRLVKEQDLRRSAPNWVYDEKQARAVENARIAAEKAKKVYLDGTKVMKENKTISFENADGLGIGDGSHINENTLGHTRYAVTKEEPGVFHVLESQSDYYQGSNPLRRLAKEEKGLQTSIDHRATMDANSNFTDADYEDLILSPRRKDVEKAKKAVTEEQSHAGYRQKELLGKNHEERLLQENIMEAVNKGQSKVRYPTSETAAKIQGYSKKEIDTDEINKAIKSHEYDIKFFTDGIAEDKLAIKNGKKKADHYDVVEKNTLATIARSQKQIDELAKQLDAANNKFAGFDSQHVTILKKYDNAPKLMKKIGADSKVITDSKGNTWYEMDIPKKFKKVNPELKALSFGGFITSTNYTSTKNKK